MMLRLIRFALVGCVCLGCVAGCARSGEGTDPAVGGETNWLRRCDADSECAQGDCVCGVCSRQCDEDADCPGQLVCQAEGDRTYDDTCAALGSDAPGLCSPQCETAADCGPAQGCAQGACVPAPMGADAGGASGGTGSAGGAGASSPANAVAPLDGMPALFVDANLRMDATCQVSVNDPLGAGEGTVDISPGGDGNGDGCRNPYLLRLRVRSDAPAPVLVSSARVELRTVADQRILFDRLNPPLPNPFMQAVASPVPTSDGEDYGVVIFDALPSVYQEQLDSFAGTSVLIEVQLQGETGGGDTVVSNTFTFPVEVCDGCLTTCLQEVLDVGLIVDEVPGATCGDSTSADGRTCVDPEC
ncbi:MAG: hypothetical protein PVI30_23405 [Myxococcales bacterium]|jgi:hypothetical protein